MPYCLNTTHKHTTSQRYCLKQHATSQRYAQPVWWNTIRQRLMVNKYYSFKNQWKCFIYSEIGLSANKHFTNAQMSQSSMWQQFQMIWGSVKWDQELGGLVFVSVFVFVFAFVFVFVFVFYKCTGLISGSGKVSKWVGKCQMRLRVGRSCIVSKLDSLGSWWLGKYSKPQFHGLWSGKGWCGRWCQTSK